MGDASQASINTAPDGALAPGGRSGGVGSEAWSWFTVAKLATVAKLCTRRELDLRTQLDVDDDGLPECAVPPMADILSQSSETTRWVDSRRSPDRVEHPELTRSRLLSVSPQL
jgi:hypothetical protein